MRPLSSDSLPAPTPDADRHSQRMVERIRAEIASVGAISFARFMALALYAPGLGYYSAGARKLGRDGDFTTAPEMTPLFADTLARQAAALIGRGLVDVLEIGAGTGALAAGLLAALDTLHALPRRYCILEPSAELRERARAQLARRAPQIAERVLWLDALPARFEGLVIGNEVLDALPVELIRIRGRHIDQAMVESSAQGFSLTYRPAQAELHKLATRIARDHGLIEHSSEVASGYGTEVPLIARAFMRTVVAMLQRGVALFIDYGFPAREYYHPERSSGTLMCHYRHRAHPDPFFLPGLQDITAHVDFSAMAQAAEEAGGQVLGYTTQASFLINCGITELLARVPAERCGSLSAFGQRCAQRLLSPSEMGELFKVIAIGKNWPEPLVGFRQGDRSASL